MSIETIEGASTVPAPPRPREGRRPAGAPSGMAPAIDESLDVLGPPDAPSIVFIHGAVMTRAQWHLQVDHLAGAGYRCIAVDLPGHGSLAGREFTLDSAADRVVEVIDRVARGRAVLVGLSLGGYVAMTVAGQSPDRVRGLVLAGSTREPSGFIRPGFTIVGWGLASAPEPVLRRLVGWLWRRRYGPEIAASILAGGYYAKGGGTAIRTLPGNRFRDRLVAYGGPILVINGSLDWVFRFGETSFLDGVPGVTRRRLRWAAHLSNLDRPDDFSNAVEAFVGSLQP